jgi:hypothetical protein
MSEAKLQTGTAKRSRFSARLAAILENKLMAYATAASAAGAALLSPSAEAKVVYTPANLLMTTHQNFSLDLNNDGIRDFIFSFWTYQGQRIGIKPTKLHPEDAIWGTGPGSASALSSGVTVGPSAPFKAERLRMVSNDCSSGHCSSTGPWKNAQDKYLGFSFVINGKVHYGWARLNASVTKNRLTATVTGYAYETEANTPIVTGQTDGAVKAAPQALAPRDLNPPAEQAGSLGHLASGASGIDAWRQEQQ